MFLPQIRARAAGQIVAPEQILNMTNARRLEEFTAYMAEMCSIVDALPVKQAASLHDLRASGERIRQHRIQVRRLQKQQAEALASSSGAPAAPQPIIVSSKRKRGGVGVSKKCSACGLHKTKETGHTNSTCSTHCLKCKRKWRDKSRGLAARVLSWLQPEHMQAARRHDRAAGRWGPAQAQTWQVYKQ